MEFDHLFITVAAPALEADVLKDFGLTEGAANNHPGQGTANRRFFFQNSFIELLYIIDVEEVENELTKPTNLHERFPPKSGAVSPFGVCFRPSEAEQDVPFPSWNYKPQYLPSELDIAIGDSPSSEPMWFYLAFASRPDVGSPESRQPAIHECGFEQITSIKIGVPVKEKLSEPAAVVNNVSNIEIHNSGDHLLQIGFDSEVSGQIKDFRPLLPLIFRW